MGNVCRAHLFPVTALAPMWLCRCRPWHVQSYVVPAGAGIDPLQFSEGTTSFVLDHTRSKKAMGRRFLYPSARVDCSSLRSVFLHMMPSQEAFSRPTSTSSLVLTTFLLFPYSNTYPKPKFKTIHCRRTIQTCGSEESGSF
jgi:hypothetical protein